MVQVQSSWFPLIDRNPQTFVPNIFEAKNSDFRVTTQKIFRSPTQASFISLPVVQNEGRAIGPSFRAQRGIAIVRSRVTVSSRVLVAAVIDDSSSIRRIRSRLRR